MNRPDLSHSLVPSLSGGPKNLKSSIMMLSGHENEVLSVVFHPSGDHLVSSGKDKGEIRFWNVYGDCLNWHVLKAHKSAVTDIAFDRHGIYMAACSVDQNVSFYDFEQVKKIRSFKKSNDGHASIVNSCDLYSVSGCNYIASGCDDGNLILWDSRQKNAILKKNFGVPITSVVFDRITNADRVVFGAIDNNIRIFDVKKQRETAVLAGHTDSVTGLDISSDGQYLISNSMDGSILMWDIYPFSQDLSETNRLIRRYAGHCNGLEQNLIRCAFSCDGKYICSGSADNFLYVYDSVTGELVYKLPGHAGCVNAVDFGVNDIVASGGADGQIFLGALQ